MQEIYAACTPEYAAKINPCYISDLNLPEPEHVHEVNP
jgi:hypothetical protein